MDGERIQRRWYKMPKKIYANRYSTDCLAGIFERRAEENDVGIDDLPEYVSGRATWEELQVQHSFFQSDMERVRGKGEEPLEEEPAHDVFEVDDVASGFLNDIQLKELEKRK